MPRDASLIGQAVSRATLVEAPYAHLVADDALPDPVATTLLDEMPALDVLAQGLPLGSNVRFFLPTRTALDDPRVSKRWKEAIVACNEHPQHLLEAVVGRLGTAILDACPGFETKFGPIDELEAVQRGQPDRRRHQVGMDVQIVVNSPALTNGTSVRGPHLDMPDKLISGLLYLRAPSDHSRGAELELHRVLTDVPRLGEVNAVATEQVAVERRYPYRHNLLVLPANGPRSVHGVTARAATPLPRYQLHIVGEMSAPLFDVHRA